MEIRQAILSQYRASFAMLREVLVKCPAAAWGAPGEKEAAWEKAYHAMHIAHMYLQPTLEAFTPWEKHREPDQGAPYTQAELLQYLDMVEAETAKQISAVNLEAPSGFHWLAMNKLELQIYNIRHIQQHIGELYERLDHYHIELQERTPGTSPARAAAATSRSSSRRSAPTTRRDRSSKSDAAEKIPKP